MDIYEIRKSRVEELLGKYKTQKALADAIGREPAYVSFILSNNPTYKKKIGEDLARDIEKILDLGVGWLDRAEGKTSELELVVEGYQRGGEGKRNAMKELAELPEELVTSIGQIIESLKKAHNPKT